MVAEAVEAEVVAVGVALGVALAAVETDRELHQRPEVQAADAAPRQRELTVRMALSNTPRPTIS